MIESYSVDNPNIGMFKSNMQWHYDEAVIPLPEGVMARRFTKSEETVYIAYTQSKNNTHITHITHTHGINKVSDAFLNEILEEYMVGEYILSVDLHNHSNFVPTYNERVSYVGNTYGSCSPTSMPSWVKDKERKAKLLNGIPSQPTIKKLVDASKWYRVDVCGKYAVLMVPQEAAMQVWCDSVVLRDHLLSHDFVELGEIVKIANPTQADLDYFEDFNIEVVEG